MPLMTYKKVIILLVPTILGGLSRLDENIGSLAITLTAD
jgi:hypothetical protein